jgi:hypothetical protein
MSSLKSDRRLLRYHVRIGVSLYYDDQRPKKKILDFIKEEESRL